MALTKVYGVRRHEDDGRLEVRIAGGWISFGLCREAVQKYVWAHPSSQPFLIRPEQFQMQRFKVGLGAVKRDPQHGPDEVDGDNRDDDYDYDYGDDDDDEGEADGESQGEGGPPPECYLLGAEADGDRPVLEAPPIIGGMIAGAVRKVEEQIVIVAAGVTATATDLFTLRLATEASLESLGAKLNGIEQNGTGGTITIKVETGKAPPKLKEGLFHTNFPQLVKFVASGNHVYLPGPPGTGKSHAAESVADVLGWRFGSISLGPQTPDSRLWGGKDAHGHFHEPTFIELARYAQENPESGAVFCLDELDNGNPGNLATLNTMMANGWFTAPNGDHIVCGRNYVIIGAANTYGTGPTAEFSGRNRLDAATLDRFLYLPWDTDLNVEKTLVNAHCGDTIEGKKMAKDWLNVWRTARKNVEDNNLKVFVTMRGAINGARLLSQGVTVHDAFMAVLGSKLPVDQFRKVNPL